MSNKTRKEKSSYKQSLRSPSSDAPQESKVSRSKNPKKSGTPQTYKGEGKLSSLILSGSPESPECNYNIPAAKLVEILQAHGFGKGTKDGGHRLFESVFTDLKSYEDYSILNPPQKTQEEEVHQTDPPFEEKIVNALFWVPKLSSGRSEKISSASKTKKTKKGGYKYLKVRLAPSNIKAAGIGAYAVDPIPKGARGVYKGIPLKEKYANMYYSWTVKTFDPDTGEADENDDPLYYVDATKLEVSNWTRYVNCGMRKKFNNFDSDQLYDKFFYVATKNIEKDEELFIDYGESYRVDNLEMTGKY